MKLEKLFELISQRWIDRWLINSWNAKTQTLKLSEELWEFCKAKIINDEAEMIDAIWDIIVVSINLKNILKKHNNVTVENEIIELLKDWQTYEDIKWHELEEVTYWIWLIAEWVNKLKEDFIKSWYNHLYRWIKQLQNKHFEDMSIETELEWVYNVIKDRKWKMINWNFLKEEDLNK